MEEFDVLDKNRNKLNYTKTRGEKLNYNEYNQGAEIWLINNNKLLITQRSKNKSHPLMWETPGGCSIKGENSLETIIREAKEEINVELDKNDLILLDTTIYKNQFVDIYKTEKKIRINNIKLQQEEVSDFKFVSKEVFEDMINNKEIVPSVIDRYKIIKEKLFKTKRNQN